MPEAAMHKYRNPSASEHNVGSTREVSTVETVTQSESMEYPPDHELGGRVGAAHCRHDFRPLGPTEYVHVAPDANLFQEAEPTTFDKMSSKPANVSRGRTKAQSASSSPPFRLIDLFSGCGGMTLGFNWSQRLFQGDTHPILSSLSLPSRPLFVPVFANDFNAPALATYRANFDHSGKHSSGESIEDLLKGNHAIPSARVLIGGPPCQGFSLLNKWRTDDSRRSLWWHFLEVATRAGAEVIVMENVPQLLGSPEFQAMWRRLRTLGYKYRMAHVLCAADYGVPQTRSRAFILASRETPIALPWPTHLAPARIGRLNGATERWGLKPTPWRTVKEAFAGLGEPSGTEIRTGAKPALVLHFGRNPTADSIRRYRAVPKGGNRFDLMKNLRELTPACWIKKTSGGTDLFGRLWSDRPSVTIRTEFFKPEKGRYLHPVEDRPITHREAARIQCFPDGFLFSGSKTEIARQIGNAVPPLLAYAVARAVQASLEGKTDVSDMQKTQDVFRELLGQRLDAVAFGNSQSQATSRAT